MRPVFQRWTHGATGQYGRPIPVTVDTGSFLVIVCAAALAALVTALLSRRVPVPVVVVEMLLGIVVGPEVLKLAEPDAFIQFFANLGLGMLFFFAGYEIDFRRVRGEPLRLAVLLWVISLCIAYSASGALALAGIVLSVVFTGSAMATTALGTLIPILSDDGALRTRFGTYVLGAGAIGEFGPILLVTIVLSTRNPLDSAAFLLAFVGLAVITAVLAVRSVGAGWTTLERTLETSGQLAVRVCVVLVFLLVTIAADLGLELLLGGFVAGLITRTALHGREVERLESKLVAIGYGFFIPFFFVVTGLQFDLDALLGSVAGVLKLPLFVAMFLLVRGVPALVLYRGVLPLRDRMALGLFAATQLPLVVAITTLAVEGGHMRTSTAAALTGAALLSTMLFPVLGLRVRRGQLPAGQGRSEQLEEPAGA